MNNLKEILEAMGFKIDERYPLPFADHVLEKLNMTTRRLAKLINRQDQMTLQEAENIAEWLGINVTDLSKSEGSVSVSIFFTLKEQEHAAA